MDIVIFVVPSEGVLTSGFVFRIIMDIHILDLVDNYDYD